MYSTIVQSQRCRSDSAEMSFLPRFDGGDFRGEEKLLVSKALLVGNLKSLGLLLAR